jgi:hypothetical protein
VPVADVNTASPEHDPWVSEDGLTMYFVRDVNGQRIWMTTRERS